MSSEKRPSRPPSRSRNSKAISYDDTFDDLEEFHDSDDNPEFEVPVADGPPPPDAKPNPVPLQAPINPEGGKQSVELHRNLFCVHYDGCLDEAVKAGWNSFTCLRCAFYHSGRKVEEAGVERFATQRRAT